MDTKPNEIAFLMPSAGCTSYSLVYVRLCLRKPGPGPALRQWAEAVGDGAGASTRPAQLDGESPLMMRLLRQDKSRCE